MHDSCLTFCSDYILSNEIQGKSVLEVGSCDVNGSARSIIEQYGPCRYIGVDRCQGDGVDVICSAENLVDIFGENSFDVVISTEMMEHVKDWQAAISNMKKVCKPNGIIIITTRSKGFPYHEYPGDYWRFEIDDMKCIFSDCTILALEKDVQDPGVFVKVKKPVDFIEKDISGYSVYSMMPGQSERLKILVTAKYVTGVSREGGSGRFMRCIIDTLVAMGHEVITTTTPGRYVNEKFDLIICSHLLNEIKDNPAKKICISHGLIPDEYFTKGADRYISVSEEVRDAHLERGFLSEVVGQPIVIPEHSYPNKELKNILVIRREAVAHDPFAFLKEKYDLRYSDLDTPIEEQIKWADLCITLGRGALEAMSYGRCVLVADNRPYIGNYGDGYVSPESIGEIAKHNFSGRRFKYTVTREWIESELAKYKQWHSAFIYAYIREKHEASIIINQYLRQDPKIKIGFGALVNDPMRLEMVLRQSEIEGEMYFIKEPHSATSGLNKLLNIMQGKGMDVAALVHQDMYFRQGWIDIVRSQLDFLPENWVVAGIIGKDEKGVICGRLHDTRMPFFFNSDHKFPVKASCFDECCIFVNLKSGFRFDEMLDGFDLYGTLAVLQAEEMGVSAWVIDAWAEHYCLRPFPWRPKDDFWKRAGWIKKRFPNARRIDSTVFGANGEIFNPGEVPDKKEVVVWAQ